MVTQKQAQTCNLSFRNKIIPHLHYMHNALHHQVNILKMLSHYINYRKREIVAEEDLVPIILNLVPILSSMEIVAEEDLVPILSPNSRPPKPWKRKSRFFSK